MGGLAEPVEGVEGEPLGMPFGFVVAVAPVGGVGRTLGAVEGMPGTRPWSALALAEVAVVAEGVLCTLWEVGMVDADPWADAVGWALSIPEGTPVAVPVPCG